MFFIVWLDDSFNFPLGLIKYIVAVIIMHCVKHYLLMCKVLSQYKSVIEVMLWFIMCMNESIESTFCEHVHFQGSNSVALFTFENIYCASSSRFGTHIVFTVILTNYEHTHKAITRQSVWNGFLLTVKTPTPQVAHLLALSHVYRERERALT